MNKIITSSLLLALTLLSNLVSASEQPPNIVVIFTDDQSYTAMGAKNPQYGPIGRRWGHV